MKNLILLFLGVLSYSLVLNAQYLLPEFGEGTLITDYSGTIQDHAGDATYNNGIDGQVTIAPPSAVNVTLTFELFELEGNFDYLYVYDGPDTSSPLIGQYSGADLTEGSIVETGGVMTLRMTSDGSVTYQGFTATWESCDINTAAQFSVSDTNPAVNTPISFINESQGSLLHNWDFGDGQTSTEQNPVHAYATAGTYTVVLNIENVCTSDTASYETTITTQGNPDISINATGFDVTLAYGDSIAYTLTVTNNGEGDLFFDVDGASLLSEKTLQVLVLVNGADLDAEYINTINALNTSSVNFTLNELTTYDAAVLETALNTQDILLIPEQEDCDGAAFSTFAPVVQNFVNAGGTLILNGTNQADCILNLGVFTGNYVNFFSDDVTVNMPEDPIMEGVSNPYTATVATFYYNFTNENLVTLVDYTDDIGNTYPVVTYQYLGEGKAIYVGHDYRYSNNDIDLIMANILKEKETALLDEGGSTWLYLSELTDTLAAGENVTLDLEFNATGVFGGTYTTNLTFNSNDPDSPATVIPCTLVIDGEPSYGISPGSYDFGPIMVGDTLRHNFTVVNPGTDSLEVYSITFDNPEFTANPSSFQVYGGGGEQIVEVTFAPTAITTYNTNMTLETNVGGGFSYFVDLSGEGLGAPTATLTPLSIEETIDAGTSTSVDLLLSNIGEGPMTYSIDTSTFSPQLKILTYLNTINANSGVNILNIVNDYYPDFDLTSTDTTDPDELATALEGVNLFAVLATTEFNQSVVFNNFSTVLNNYVNNGGTVVFLGNFGITTVFDSGLFSGSNSFNSYSGCNIDNTHPITQGLPEFYNPGTINPINITNTDATILVTQNDYYYGGSSAVVATRNIGAGEVIYIGQTYANFYTTEEEEMLGNTLLYVANNNLVEWLSLSPSSGNLDFPNGEATITVNLDATNLLGGVYTSEIVITTNDPLNETIIVPVTLNVVGLATIDLSDTSLDFGNVIVGNTNTLTFTITNNGTADLEISDITADLGELTFDTESITLVPFASTTVTATFTPDEMEILSGTITITSNLGTTDITVDAVGTGAPLIIVNPSTITVDLINDETSTETINLANNGQGPLEYTFDLPLPIPEWLTFDETAGTVAIDGNTDLSVVFNANGLTNGTYTYDMFILSNDPLTPSKTITLVLNVSAVPAISFSTEDLLTCDGEVIFTDLSANDPTSWTWDFGDGNTSDEQNPTHTYTENGLYAVSLEACNDLGCNDLLLENYITVDLGATTCDTLYMPISGTINTNSCNGILVDSGGPNGEYTNSENGIVTIEIPGATSITITFSEFNLENSFDYLWIYEGTDLNGSLVGQFSDLNLPNGNGIVTVQGSAVTINMTSDGSVTRPGFVATWSCVNVTEAPIAAFEYTVVDACLGIIELNDTSDNYPSEWSWVFPDEVDPITGEGTLEYAFPQSGTYPVTLEVCNLIGCESITQDVIISDVLFVDASIPETIDVGIPIQFSDNTEGATAWEWAFGNGQGSFLQSPVTFYTETGFYTLTLTVTTDNCVRTITYDLEIVPVGVSSITQEATNYTLSPNPTQGLVNIAYAFEGQRNLDIRVFDALGKQIMVQKTNAVNGYNNTINLSTYAKGMYYITISSDQGRVSKKIVLH